jgi:hypothetical protein
MPELGLKRVGWHVELVRHEDGGLGADDVVVLVNQLV